MDWHARHPDYEVREPRVKEAQWPCVVPNCRRRYVRRQALVEHVRNAHPGEPLPPPAVVTEVAAKLAGIVNGAAAGGGGEMVSESDGGMVKEAQAIGDVVEETTTGDNVYAVSENGDNEASRAKADLSDS